MVPLNAAAYLSGILGDRRHSPPPEEEKQFGEVLCR
jgi:hypothetical protein